MTLYNRPRAEVFAENAPPSEIQPFQAWLRGLGIAFDETNGLPEMTGLNGLFNALNQYIKYLEQNGFAEWTSTLEYPIGAGVRVGAVWYRAKTRNTNKPPATSQNDWAVFLNGADVASASTLVKGIVQLSNVLNSTSTTQALTAAQGKVLQDNKFDKTGGSVNGAIDVKGVIRGSSFVELGLGAPDSNRSVTFYNQDGTGRGAIRALPSGEMQFRFATSYTFDKTVDADISGNAASATNCSRSIVAGNGLSGGGDLTANRTLTLGTPGTVTASTGNTVSASSHTHSLAVGSLPLLGVGQTWQNVTGSRSLGTTYTNTTGRPIEVSISLPDTGSQSPTVTINVGGVNILINNYDSINGIGSFSHSFTVPAGATYRISVNISVPITTWAELR